MKWEYKTVKFAASGFMGGNVDSEEVDATLNELGHDGWELVAGFDSNSEGGRTRDVIMVFKRPTS